MEWATINLRNRGGANRITELFLQKQYVTALNELSPLTYKTVIQFQWNSL